MAYKNIGNGKQITKNLTRLHRATYSWKINSQNDSSVRASGKTVVEKQNSTYERMSMIIIFALQTVIKIENGL